MNCPVTGNRRHCPWRFSWKPGVRNGGRGMAKGGKIAHFAVMGKPCCHNGAMDWGLSRSQSKSRLQLWFLMSRGQEKLWIVLPQYCRNTVLMDLIRVLFLVLKIHEQNHNQGLPLFCLCWKVLMRNYRCPLSRSKLIDCSWHVGQYHSCNNTLPKENNFWWVSVFFSDCFCSLRKA